MKDGKLRCCCDKGNACPIQPQFMSGPTHLSYTENDTFFLKNDKGHINLKVFESSRFYNILIWRAVSFQSFLKSHSIYCFHMD